MPTPTETLIPVYSLSGTVFFDYNGSGEQDLAYGLNAHEAVQEPGIAGAQICLDGRPDAQSCISSDENGFYAFEHVPAGRHRLLLESPTDDPATAFRYINISRGWVDIPAYEMNGVQVPEQHLPYTEVQPIGNYITMDIEEDTEYDVALMQGYLTAIFPCSVVGSIDKFHGYDLDPNPGTVRNFLGETELNVGPHQEGGTGDGHLGVDWGSNDHSIIGSFVVAAAPGSVNFAGEIETWHGLPKNVTLEHNFTAQKTGYGHLDQILVSQGSEVLRGQIIGTIGMSGTIWPHVHFAFHPSWDRVTAEAQDGDPFRDVVSAESFSWWTFDNTPICLR